MNIGMNEVLRLAGLLEAFLERLLIIHISTEFIGPLMENSLLLRMIGDLWRFLGSLIRKEPSLLLLELIRNMLLMSSGARMDTMCSVLEAAILLSCSGEENKIRLFNQVVFFMVFYGFL